MKLSICLTILCVLVSISTNALGKFGELEQFLKRRIVEMNLPYKNLKFSIKIERNKGNNDAICLSILPEGILDRKVVSNLEKELSLYRGEKMNWPNELYGHIKIDGFTDDVFVAVYEAMATVNHSEVEASPRDGMPAFTNRWSSFLDSLGQNGEFVWGDLSSDYWLEFEVEKDGSLISHDTSAYQAILCSFLKNEHKWNPGVIKGRPLKARVKLLLPRYRPTVATIKAEMKFPQVDSYALHFEDRKVFFTRYKLNNLTNNINLVSVVNYNQKYESPVVHRGDLLQCKELIDFLLDSSFVYYSGGSHGNQFERVYFFTDVK